jgi:segregation and condensation protein A
MAYQIKLQNFEGPFDLLLHLIEKTEIDIYDIPVAEITNQYLEYIYEMQSLDLDVASEFIVMAATLIQIKSRMLLPKEPNPMDEISAEGVDPRAELVERLLEYKKYKLVAELFRDMEEAHIGIVYKNGEIIDDIDEDKLLSGVGLSQIIDAFNDIVKRYNEKLYRASNLEHQVIREEFTVDDKIDSLRKFINNNSKAYFKQLLENCTSRLEIIITFLALLELIRLKEISINQNSVFGDIIIECC